MTDNLGTSAQWRTVVWALQPALHFHINKQTLAIVPSLSSVYWDQTWGYLHEFIFTLEATLDPD